MITHGIDAKMSNCLSGDAQKTLKTYLKIIKGAAPEGYKNWDETKYYCTIPNADNIRIKYYDSNKGKEICFSFIRIGFDNNMRNDIIIVFQHEAPEAEIKEEEENITILSTANQLKNVVSTWYFILRNLALIVLMLVLIYTGIRIVISSTAGEKAKYKERLTDWLVSICLVMIMHYIMAFSVNIVEQITKLIELPKNSNLAYIELKDSQKANAERELKDFDTTGQGTAIDTWSDGVGENGAIVWPTDLVGLFKIQSQMTEEGTESWIAYSFGYVILVLYTLFFAFTYLRRVLYMAFLTMMAPMVAMTYPIDKMTDGKAQAFDAWFKEYIFNLMIQPLHLLLYTILVSSAYTLASENILYTLVALGFMLPAEKLMRRFFGFEKAKTPGLLGGAAGAALTMSGMQKLLGHRPQNGGKSNVNVGGSNTQKQTKLKFANKNKINAQDAIVGDGINSQQNSTQGNTESEREQTVRESNATNQNEENQNTEPQESNEDSEESTTIDINSGRTEAQNANTTNASSSRGRTGRIPVNVDPAGNSNKKKRHIFRAVGTVTAGVGKQAVAGVLRGVHPVRMFGKAMAGATGLAAGGLLGIATGDPNKVLQYSGIGGGAAMKFAGSLPNKNIISDDLKEKAKMSFYGDDYQEVMQEKKKEQLAKNDEYINYIKQTMSVNTKQAKEILETTGSQCFDNGIEDIEDIATIHELTHSGSDSMSFEKAVAGRSYAKKRLAGADIDSMTPDKIKKYKDRWKDEFKAKYNFDDATAGRYADEAFNTAIRFNNTKSSLTKI